MWNGPAFTGSKIALLVGGGLITYKRDQKADIPFPGMWDLPGGGREGDESPVECAIREVHEEFGIAVDPSLICWERPYPGRLPKALVSFFLVAHISPDHVRRVNFGSEGACWEIMSVDRFLSHPEVVVFLKRRLQDYLGSGCSS